MENATTQTGPLQAGLPPSRFSDVCGTIDALKQVLHEAPAAAAASSGDLEALLDDALTMQERMEQRLREYEGFREQIVAIAAALQELRGPRRQDAVAAAALLRPYLRQGRTLTEQERAAAVEHAEAVRAVA